MMRKLRHPVALFTAVVAAVATSACASPSTSVARFRATETGIEVFSQSSLGIAFKVENVGGAAGTPSCTVKAVAVLTFSNHDGGVNHVVLRKIGPGRYDYESYSADRVAVSGDAANLAAMGTLKVACVVAT